MRNISDSSSLVVLRNLEGSLVPEIGLRFEFELEPVVFLHFIEGPSGTDGQNVLSSMLALVLIVVISDETGLVCINCASAVLWQKFKTEPWVN